MSQYSSATCNVAVFVCNVYSHASLHEIMHAHRRTLTEWAAHSHTCKKWHTCSKHRHPHTCTHTHTHVQQPASPHVCAGHQEMAAVGNLRLNVVYFLQTKMLHEYVREWICQRLRESLLNGYVAWSCSQQQESTYIEKYVCECICIDFFSYIRFFFIMFMNILHEPCNHQESMYTDQTSVSRKMMTLMCMHDTCI